MPVSQQIEPVAAFALSSRPYRESSSIVDFFTRDHGKLRAIVRGVRKEKSQVRALVQPFVPLSIRWYSRGGDLQTITHAEDRGVPMLSSGEPLYCGLYLNELILYLVQDFDPQPGIYDAFVLALSFLPQEHVSTALILRQFELFLLTEMGYEPPFMDTIDGDYLIDSEEIYGFRADVGVIRISGSLAPGWIRVTGLCLLKLAQRDFDLPIVLQQSRAVLRHIIDFHTGGKEFASRRLYRDVLIVSDREKSK